MSTDSKFPVLLNVKLVNDENHCHVKADITGFRANNVRVTPWDDSLIVEMSSEHEPHQSYYLGEAEETRYRRIVPLGFQVSEKDVMTHYQNGKLDISIAKRTDRVTAPERANRSYG